MSTIIKPSFTETVVFEREGNYQIAQGWTTSTGQDPGWIYKPPLGGYGYKLPAGWMFDQRYSDIRGDSGTHGGCSSCIMTLVHLITTEEVYDNGTPLDPIPGPEPTPDDPAPHQASSGTEILIIAAAIGAAYMILR